MTQLGHRFAMNRIVLSILLLFMDALHCSNLTRSYTVCVASFAILDKSFRQHLLHVISTDIIWHALLVLRFYMFRGARVAVYFSCWCEGLANSRVHH